MISFEPDKAHTIRLSLQFCCSHIQLLTDGVGGNVDLLVYGFFLRTLHMLVSLQ